MKVAHIPTLFEYTLDQRSRCGTIASAKMALGEHQAEAPARISQVGALEPRHCLAQVRYAGIDPTGSYLRIATRTFCRCSVVWQCSARQRLAAILSTSFRIALIAVCQPHPPQADNTLPSIIESGAVFDGAPAIF